MHTSPGTTLLAAGKPRRRGGYRWPRRTLRRALSYEGLSITRRARCDLRHGQVSSGGSVPRLVMPGRNAFASVASQGAHPTYPGGRRRHRRSVPQSRLLAGTTFRRRDPSAAPGFSAQLPLGHTPPGPAPAASGRSGNSGEATRAPVGIRPVSAYRQSAAKKLRASATVMPLWFRPRAPAVRAWDHWLSALLGWKRIRRHAICTSWARTQAGLSRPVPWSRWTSTLAHGVGVSPAQPASSRRLRSRRWKTSWVS